MTTINNIPRNLTTGRWAVAIDGMCQWRTTMGLGDGITQASMALVTRADTRAEAEEIAARLREMQPGLLPGQGAAYSVVVTRYRRQDYVSSQDRRNPKRYQTVRVANSLIPGGN